MVEIQIEEFVKTCIRRVDGWAEYSVERLLSMPDACEDLWAEVTALAAKVEGEADAAAKKPQTISSGPESGQEKPNSTESLKHAAG
jgi:hypothetical protein